MPIVLGAFANGSKSQPGEEEAPTAYLFDITAE